MFCCYKGHVKTVRSSRFISLMFLHEMSFLQIEVKDSDATICQCNVNF